jgi:hypothetical protein
MATQEPTCEEVLSLAKPLTPDQQLRKACIPSIMRFPNIALRGYMMS